MRRLEALLLLSALSTACLGSPSSNNPPSTTEDAATDADDAASDASSDASSDGANDASRDSASDATNTDAGSDVVSTDAGSDVVSTDAGSDVVSTDAGSDASVDSAVDAGTDASVDSAVDAGADASVDSSVDASVDSSVDASSDATVDSTVDASVDVTVDSTVDAGSDATVDSTVDASVDSGTDASVDSAVDASADSATDAGSDATVDAGSDASTGAPVELWILRVGDGTAALTNAATALFLERRASTDGTVRGAPIALPVAVSGANRPITISGTATSEGSLTRSADGRFVVLAGYAATPGTAAVASTATDTVPRVVARVSGAGAIDSSTTFGAAYSANNIRGAATVDGTAFWTAGTGAAGAAGIQYKLLGATGEPVNVLAAPANVRTVNIFGGQLFGVSATTSPTGIYGIFAAGTGTPTTTGATATLLPGFSTTSGPSPYSFYLLDRSAAVPGLDTAYIADDRAVASGGGIQRWTLAGGTWTLGATFNTGLTSGARGVVAWADGADVVIAAVTAESPSRVVTFRDVPGAMPGMATVVSTAPTNTHYRGLALAPTP